MSNNPQQARDSTGMTRKTPPNTLLPILLTLPSPAPPGASNQFLWFIKTMQGAYIFWIYDVQLENGTYTQLIGQQTFEAVLCSLTMQKPVPMSLWNR